MQLANKNNFILTKTPHISYQALSAPYDII